MVPIFDALLPITLAALLTPVVDTIQVEMLGTVNMVMAPMMNVIITIPKESTPLAANQLSFSMLAPSLPINSW